MRILVTAGNTQVPIDRVRHITNGSTGRTGTRIALHGLARGHEITLLTSHPEVIKEMRGVGSLPPGHWIVQPYRTIAELHARLEQGVRRGGPDAVIHCAAVSDYDAAGIFAPSPTTRFDDDTGCWKSGTPAWPALLDRAAGKVKSDDPELWLRLRRTPKLIDAIRQDWGFQGILVKFKLEVGLAEDELLDIAERSRRQSGADLMVANTVEGAETWACLGPLDGRYQRLARPELAARLVDAVERLHRERSHG